MKRSEICNATAAGRLLVKLQVPGCIRSVASTVLVCLAATVLALVPTQAFSQDIVSQFMNLDDNAVPSGWTLENRSYDGCCGGIEEGRLWARIIDANYHLSEVGSLPPGTTSLTLEYDADIAYSLWGRITATGVQVGTDTMSCIHGTSQYVYGDVSRARIFRNNSNDGLLLSQDFPPEYVSYHYAATFTDGTIRYKATRLSDGAVLFDLSASDPTFALADVDGVWFDVYATTDNDCWMDNLRVTVASEEPQETCDEFDGSSINTSLWNPVSDTWTVANGQITGYWPLSDAHGEQANLLWIASSGQTEYTFEADMVMQSDGYGHRIVLYNSAGNKYNVTYNGGYHEVLTQVKQNGGWYVGLPQYEARDLSYFDGTPGLIHNAKVVRSRAEFTFYLDDHELFTLDESIWGGDVTVGIGAYGPATYEQACFTGGTTSCCIVRGDLDHNGSGPDITDLVYLVTYMFGGGPSPACEEPVGSGYFAEADFDGNGTGPDITDLVYCVTYMFGGGPAPVPCGERGAAKAAAIGGEVTLRVSHSAGVTTLTSSSQLDLLGFEFTLAGSGTGQVRNMAGDQLETFSGLVDGNLRVGLLDMQAAEAIQAGEHTLLEIAGQWEVVSALACDRQLRTLQPGVVSKVEPVVPAEFTLYQNYPNPFNPTTEISFSLPQAGEATLEIFNIMGQKVATLVDEHLEAGQHTYQWIASDNASGVYLYRLTAEGMADTRKLLLIK